VGIEEVRDIEKEREDGGYEWRRWERGVRRWRETNIKERDDKRWKRSSRETRRREPVER
jgi:hypothetical protein